MTKILRYEDLGKHDKRTAEAMICRSIKKHKKLEPSYESSTKDILVWIKLRNSILGSTIFVLSYNEKIISVLVLGHVESPLAGGVIPSLLWCYTVPKYRRSGVTESFHTALCERLLRHSKMCEIAIDCGNKDAEKLARKIATRFPRKSYIEVRDAEHGKFQCEWFDEGKGEFVVVLKGDCI